MSPPPSRSPSLLQRLSRRAAPLFTAATLSWVFPACQSFNLTQPTGNLEKAQQAWQALERASPGTPSARRALLAYDQAVRAVVRSLREKEGSAAWGKELSIGGKQPWRITFDAPLQAGSARTFTLSDFAHCQLASEATPHGFDRAVVLPGLGAPVVLAQDNLLRIAHPYHPLRGEFLPATAILEFPATTPGHPPEARLRFYNPLKVSRLKVGPNSQPLAANLTAPLQSSLTDSTLDKDDPHQAAPSASAETESQLFFLNRYDPSKIPVVFVHGLRSGPVVWKNTVNELYADPELRNRYQPACFIYPSNLPIPVSAARLRELLKRSRDTLDPAHKDRGFDQMVLVGHSMGGLLTRMQVVDSASDFWRAFFTVSPEKLASQVGFKTQRMLQNALFFEHNRAVKTVIFVTTPHQGSVYADFSIVRLALRVVLFLPKVARQRLHSLSKIPVSYVHPALRDFHSWGVDGTENLSTMHPFFPALARRPIAVRYHSVIGTRGAVDFRKGGDGIVPYWSAHLEGAASEATVPYPHGCVERAGTVKAVIKILKDTK